MLATIASPAEQRVVLHNVAWDTFERLPAMEILGASGTHDRRHRVPASLAEIVALETGRDFFPFGSTTLLRPDLEKGIEPDTRFYLRNVAQVRNKPDVDLPVHPPPRKFRIFAATLPPLTAAQATDFLTARSRQNAVEWDRDVRAWVRGQKA